MAADMQTRAAVLRRYSELEAVSLVLNNLLLRVDSGALAGFREVDIEELTVVERGPEATSHLVHEHLWPDQTEDEWESDPEFLYAQARASVLAAEILSAIASDDGRAACTAAAANQMGCVERDLVAAQAGKAADNA